MNGKIIGNYSAVGVGPGINITEKIKPDNTGYYKFVLGAFNVINSRGEEYIFTNRVKALFEKGGIIRRRLDKGECRGEYGHPDLTGMSQESALARVSIIDEKSISHHIRDIELRQQKDHQGKSIILAVGAVKPCGPYGPVLQQSIDNPSESVSYSVRSTVNKGYANGRTTKEITDAITYDYVHEPGIPQANKFYTATTLEGYGELSVEDYYNMEFSRDDIDKAIALCYSDGLESTGTYLTKIKDSYGWHEIEVIDAASIFTW
jgi:hypothetical protein